MIDRRTIGLINGEVDGVNTPGESETLRQLLAHDPEARRLLEDLQKLGRSLFSTPAVDPPAGLKAGIMRSIRERYAPAGRPTRRLSLLDHLFPSRPFPKLGFAFGGGVLAGVFLVTLYFAFASHPAIDTRDASGAIFDSAHEAFQTVDDTAFALDGVQALISTEYSRVASVMRVSLTLNQDVTARLLFDPRGAKLKGVSLAEGFPGTLMQSEGAVEVGRGGGTFKAFFAPGAPPSQDVRLQIVAGGTVVYERSCPLGKAL